MALSREVSALIALIRSFGLPHRITDINTPGVHGATSRHYAEGTDGLGLAVDAAWVVPYWGAPAEARAGMLAICAALEPHEHLLHELICSHLPYSVKDGRRVPRYAVSDHWDHIHLSVDRGVFVAPVPARMEVTVVPDDPNAPNIEGPLTFHPVINTALGECRGYYVFATRTGELHGFGAGAPFFGRSEDLTPGPE